MRYILVAVTAQDRHRHDSSARHTAAHAHNQEATQHEPSITSFR